MKARVTIAIIPSPHVTTIKVQHGAAVPSKQPHNSKLASKTVKTQAVQKFIDFARKDCLQLNESDWWFLQGTRMNSSMTGIEFPNTWGGMRPHLAV